MTPSIVEEIVGDIQDEFDEERPTAERHGKRIFSVDAKMLLEELEDILEIDIEDEDADTIGGWLYDQIGQTPRVGQMAAPGRNLSTSRSIWRASRADPPVPGSFAQLTEIADMPQESALTSNGFL